MTGAYADGRNGKERIARRLINSRFAKRSEEHFALSDLMEDQGAQLSKYLLPVCASPISPLSAFLNSHPSINADI